MVTLLCSVFWRRFTRWAAIATLAGGMAAIVLSLFVPEVIRPFAHGVPVGDTGKGIFAGMHEYKFMRALYGLVVSGGIAVLVTHLSRPEPEARCRGLVWGTVADAIRHYKGSPSREGPVRRAVARGRAIREDRAHEATGLPAVRISQTLARSLDAAIGDLVHVSDKRRWLGGIRSAHAIIDAFFDDVDEPIIELGPALLEVVVSRRRADEPLAVDRLC